MSANEPDHVSTTMAAYDVNADTYVELVGTEISAAMEAPLDRGLLRAFGELASTTQPVGDIGCGPGRVAAFLAAEGIDVIGVDVSAAMVAAARAAHPHIRFEEGRLTAIPVPDGQLGAVVCWYSIIHTPPSELSPVFAELARVLRPGGLALLAFQSGAGEAVRRTEAYGRDISLTSYRHDPAGVATGLDGAGLHLHARVTREPELAHESAPQSFLLARAEAPLRP